MIKKNLIYLFVFFTATIIAQDEVDLDYLKKMEKKWDLEGNIERKKHEESPAPQNFVPVFLTPYIPEKQEFPINPGMDNIIKGKFGTEITIPANSISLPSNFRRGDILNIKLEEVVNDLDFITAGLDLTFYNYNRNPHLFESGGMFRISGEYYNRPIKLKKGAKVKVQIEKISTLNMKVYKMDESRGWVEKGNEENQNDKSERNLRFYGLLDDFSWWNFDYANPEITCLQGKIESADPRPPFSVIVIGLNAKGVQMQMVNKFDFKINTWQNKKVKLIIVDSMGNIGVSSEIQSGKEYAFLDGKNNSTTTCQNIGSITIVRNGVEVRKNRASLLKFLGLKDDILPKN
jgi:hypothetical protein